MIVFRIRQKVSDPDVLGSSGLVEGDSPSQHGVEEDTQAPDVAGRVVALLLQHLAHMMTISCS